MNNQKPFRTTIGGQALIEGIMMRGPEKTAAVVRGPEGLETRVSDNKSLKTRFPILGLPFLRGVLTFAESMRDGYKTLMWSASFFPEDESQGEPSKLDLWLEKKGKAAETALMAISMVLGLLLAVGLFTVLPTLAGSAMSPWLGSGFTRNLLETLVRLCVLVGYLALVSRMKDIQRVFAYHGAEHKTIACYEAGQPLTVENVRVCSRMHPRCGTSFLLTVVIVGMLAFLWVTFPNPALRVALRLCLLPLVVAVSYEINRLVGKYDNPLTRFLRQPGLLLQNLTTREPDDGMIEVGIRSLELVLPSVKGEDEWK